LKGILATCSPTRPNPMRVSAAPLVARKGHIIEVKGFEAVDGSPIIDEKPYTKSYLHVDNLKMAANLVSMFKRCFHAMNLSMASRPLLPRTTRRPWMPYRSCSESPWAING